MPHLAYRDPAGRPVYLELKEQDVMIGREADCDIVLSNRAVSRHHARIKCDGARWRIEDLGSLHGTFVNRVRLTEPAVLSAGDQVNIGGEVLTFGGGPRPSDPAVIVASNLKPSTSGRGTDITPAEPVAVPISSVRDQLHACSDLDALCRTAVDLAMKVTGANRGVLAVKSKGSNEFLPRIQLVGAGRLPPAKEVRISQTFVDRLMKDRKPWMARDTDHDMTLSGAQSIVKVDIRSILGAPLLHGDALLGYLYVDTLGEGGKYRGRIFREADLKNVGEIAKTAAEELARRGAV